MTDLAAAAGFQPTEAEALAVRTASWPCPGCGETMRAVEAPEWHGSVIPFAAEKACCDACYRKTISVRTPRTEALRYAGVRPLYAETPFDPSMCDRIDVEHHGTWKDWQGDRDVLFLGPVGVGKSFLAVEMMFRAWRLGVLSQAMIQLPELITEHFDDGDHEKTLRKKAQSVRLLVFDELGRGKAASEYAAGVVTEIVEHRRSHRRTTIIATNLTRQQMESTNDALYDRMQEGLVIEFRGRSLRRTQ